MRVLHVGNGNYNHAGKKYYDVGRKLNNGLIRNGHNVFFISDRDIARSSNFLGVSKLGRSAANRYFLKVCKNFCPELIMFGHADIISPSSVAKARDILPEARFIQYNVDPIFRPHNIAMINSKAALVDVTFCTTAGEALRKFALGDSMVAFIPNPCDQSIEYLRCYEVLAPKHDVFWAMRGLKGSYKGDPRVEIPLYLEANGINISYHGFNGMPELFGAAYFEAIAQCRMGLNISVTCTYSLDEKIEKSDLYLYSSDRLSHHMGCGLLVFTTRDNSLEEMFKEGEELLFFSDAAELMDKIRYFGAHDNERRRIAKAGWERYHKCFNEKVIAKYIEEVTFGQAFSQIYDWPTNTYKQELVGGNDE